MQGADNQQERLALLGYIAGILDGEAWLGIAVTKRTDVRAGFILEPMISVHMVGKAWIEHLDHVVKQVGLPSYYVHRPTSSHWQLRGYRRTVPFLETIHPYLFIKRQQAEIMLELARTRKERHHHSSPTEADMELVARIRALNTKGKNPQRLYA